MVWVNITYVNKYLVAYQISKGTLRVLVAWRDPIISGLAKLLEVCQTASCACAGA